MWPSPESPLHRLTLFLVLGIFMPAAYQAETWNASKALTERTRRIRSLWNFRSVIRCVTGKSAADYVNYGCYCGWGGSGRPVDGIDQCCMEHDICYEGLTNSRFWAFLSFYSYECTGGYAICDEKRSSDFSYDLCRCDVTAALCFSRYVYPLSKPSCPG